MFVKVFQGRPSPRVPSRIWGGQKTRRLPLKGVGLPLHACICAQADPTKDSEARI